MTIIIEWAFLIQLDKVHLSKQSLSFFFNWCSTLVTGISFFFFFNFYDSPKNIPWPPFQPDSSASHNLCFNLSFFLPHTQHHAPHITYFSSLFCSQCRSTNLRSNLKNPVTDIFKFRHEWKKNCVSQI